MESGLAIRRSGIYCLAVPQQTPIGPSEPPSPFSNVNENRPLLYRLTSKQQRSYIALFVSHSPIQSKYFIGIYHEQGILLILGSPRKVYFGPHHLLLGLLRWHLLISLPPISYLFNSIYVALQITLFRT